MDGLQYGAGFLIFVRDGTLKMLEGYSYSEPWPELIREFELSYRMIGGYSNDIADQWRRLRNRPQEFDHLTGGLFALGGVGRSRRRGEVIAPRQRECSCLRPQFGRIARFWKLLRVGFHYRPPSGFDQWPGSADRASS